MMGSHTPLDPVDDSSIEPPGGKIAADESKPAPLSHPKQSASDRQTLLRLASAGFELASFSLILGAGGYAVDHWLALSTPYFAISGVLVGFCLGFYRLIVLASKMG